MIVLETERLRLAHLDDTNAAFMLELLNMPAWLARSDLHLPRVVAITTHANERSIRLLERIKMVEESTVMIEDEPLLLFATDWKT